VDHVSNSSDPTNTTWYYHGNQIGSLRLMSANGGWPVWQGTFLPYGEEYNPQICSVPADEHKVGILRDSTTRCHKKIAGSDLPAARPCR
jgi:hypothetical protein